MKKALIVESQDASWTAFLWLSIKNA